MLVGILGVPLLFTIFQVVSSQIPEHCRGPPTVVEKSRECCKLPDIFTDEDLKECNIDKETYEKIRGPLDCSKHVCLLKKYNLMKGEDVDKAAVAEFMDKLVEKKPEFKDVVEKAKEKCLSGELPGPPQICEANKIAFCVMFTVFDECPTWVDSDKCKKVKTHMDECKAYYPF